MKKLLTKSVVGLSVGMLFGMMSLTVLEAVNQLTIVL